jgi:hypothetical protein
VGDGLEADGVGVDENDELGEEGEEAEGEGAVPVLGRGEEQYQLRGDGPRREEGEEGEGEEDCRGLAFGLGGRRRGHGQQRRGLRGPERADQLPDIGAAEAEAQVQGDQGAVPHPGHHIRPRPRRQRLGRPRAHRPGQNFGFCTAHIGVVG